MSIFTFIACVAAGYALFFLDFVHHAGERREIAALTGIRDVASAKRAVKKFRPKVLDAVIGPLQFVGCWLIIVGMVGTAYFVAHPVFDLVTVWLVCAQLRALEELSHMAIHGAVGGPRTFQMFVADLLYQMPALKNSAEERRHRHCSLHHPNVNLPSRDPGLQDFVAIHFVPGISRTEFWLGVFHPLTPGGILERLRGIAINLSRDLRSPRRLTLRVVSSAAVIAPFWSLGWGYGFAMFYLLPLIVLFPQFYWLSQVVEHRWFENVDDMGKLERELVSGRPTLYRGLLGLLVRSSFFPVGDSHHLAHSLFPYIRWSYLGEVDRLLIRSIPEYARNQSQGLFVGGGGRPSALDHLRRKLIVTPA